MAEETFWFGKPCEAVKVRVIVADTGRFPNAWFRLQNLVGTERAAVRITHNDETFYLDDEDGSGWRKVTTGLGRPQVGHASLDVEREVDGG